MVLVTGRLVETHVLGPEWPIPLEDMGGRPSSDAVAGPTSSRGVPVPGRRGVPPRFLLAQALMVANLDGAY